MGRELQRNKGSIEYKTRGRGVEWQRSEAAERYVKGGGVLRWMSTNSTIPQLDISSRRREMSVESSPFHAARFSFSTEPF